MLKTKLTKTILKTTDNYIKWLEKAGILTIWLEHREYLIQNIEVVDIETSTACNRTCSYCPNTNYNNASIINSSFMSEEIFSKIVTDLGVENYNWEICLQRYNEPLMDERIPRLISIASKFAPNATIVIYSNGDYLTVPLYKKLIEAWLNKLTVTEHWKKPSQWLIDTINFRKNNPDQLIFKYKKMDHSWKFYNRWWEIKLSSNQPQNFFCKTLNCVTINSKGDVVLCCNDYHSQHIFWNAGTKNIIDIFLWEKFQNMRIEAVTGHFSRKICKLCMY